MIEISLYTGDIVHLKLLPNLTKIDLANTGVSGDFVHLKSLPNLTAICIRRTGVPANPLKGFPGEFVYGDKDAFMKYGKSAELY